MGIFQRIRSTMKEVPAMQGAGAQRQATAAYRGLYSLIALLLAHGSFR
jgi:hypothetical protein